MTPALRELRTRARDAEREYRQAREAERGGPSSAAVRAFVRGASLVKLASLLGCSPTEAWEWTGDPFGKGDSIRRPERPTVERSDEERRAYMRKYQRERRASLRATRDGRE